MAKKIQQYRGLEKDLPRLEEARIAFTTDTKKLFIGSKNGNVEITKEEEINRILQDVDYISNEINDVAQGLVNVAEEYKEFKDEVTTQLEQTGQEVNKHFLKPYFIEFMASFNKYGLGVPSGISNYTNGNYVLTVSGNAGDMFATVTSGNTAHAGGKWPCVIKNDDGIFDNNKVLSTDGNKLNLLNPLKRNITSGLLGNLHDAEQGQHYTELGYSAFAQHLYFAIPRYSERNSVLSQFLPTDTTGKWTLNVYANWNLPTSMKTPDDTFRSIGGKALNLYVVSSDNYTAEWEENLNGYKGYVEATVGCNTGSFKVEFYLDDILVDSKTVNREVERIIFPFEYASKGQIKIKGLAGFPIFIYIGKVTWFINEKYSKEKLINPNDKVVFMGDSWGEYHNKATTRELERLMIADGGNPTILNFSKGGRSSTYAKTWFEEYVIANKPDKVIIEYFTNDFNSIGGTTLATFENPSGQQQDMNISNLGEYVNNIQWIIDKAIENGIQPIIIMPVATNSESQTFSFGNHTNNIWNGAKTTSDSPYFTQVTTPIVTTDKVETVTNNDLIIKSKAINSAIRKGVVVDSDVTLTGGSLQRWSNNGSDVAGIRHNGRFEGNAIKLATHNYEVTPNKENTGTLYLENSAFTGQKDELKIVVQLSDGSYVTKKIQLIDY